MQPYNHKDIEKKWQDRWDAECAHVAHENTGKEKSYLLVEFPYPSGAGLHTGHVRSYTAMDIVARKRRREGKEVLYPIGWDAFGLPTENYAIKTGKNPRAVTKENTDTFRRQLKMLGLSFDWSREINTTDPAYYKWTQWIFLEMFKKGLAYKAKTEINWCPKCKIGLANEEVVEGACERCGYSPVEKREKEQWMLKITEYAQRLYDDLDTVDYIERAKIQQRNWIGPSDGALIDFEIRCDANIRMHTNETNNGDLSQYNFILLHGYAGSPKTNFLPWLKKELEQRGATVKVPALPRSEEPSEDEQVAYVLKHCTFGENTVLLGYSLGSVVAMKVLEKLNKPIAGLITVGGFCDPQFKDRPRSFESTFSWEFDFAHILKNAKRIHILHDENDHAISREQTNHLAEALGREAQTVVAEATHFQNTQEPNVLNAILSSLVPSIHTLAPITVFTTRSDTLFGATYLVLAPEHEKIEMLRSAILNWNEVEAYIKKSKQKTEMERTAEGKEKSGVELQGICAVNPANGEEIPVWIADYVLASYGTGAIMAVPAHDERDYAFASRINAGQTRKNAEDAQIVMREVITPFEEDMVKSVGAVIQTKNGEYIFQQRTKDASRSPGCLGCFGGQKEEKEKVSETLRRELMEELELDIKKNSESVRYLYSVRSSSTPEKFLVIFLITGVDDSKLVLHEGERIEKIRDLEDLKTQYQLSPSLGAFEMSMLHSVYTGEGTMINSGPFNGLRSEEAKLKITEHVGGKMVTTYKLHDWVFSRQRYWGEPIPLIFCEHCKKSARTNAEQTQKNAEEIRNAGWVPVPEKDLPVMLPEVEKYEPTDTGESPLAHITEWVHTTCPTCGGAAKRETDVMPNWAGSSWYYLRYSDPQNKTALADKEKLTYWTPVDWYNGGMEHTTLHLLYSRFWHKFLYDIGVVPNPEPYIKRTSHGLILAADGEKMSKSKGNVVNPDEIVERFGADALRIYEMFMGPFEQAIAWSTDGLVGAKRFLERVYKVSEKTGDASPEKDISALLHKTIKKVTADIEALKMNTAISQLMIFTNALEKIPVVPHSSFQTLILLLAPFAPHLAEELWEKSGEHGSVHRAPWPVFDTALLVEEEVTIAVQVNGKLRGTLRVSRETLEEEIAAQARVLPAVARALHGKEEAGIIFVPDKIINFRVG